MDEKQIRDAAKAIALEALVIRTYNLALRAHPAFTEDAIATHEAGWVTQMDQLTIGKFGPAMSDHIAAEFQEALRTLLSDARRARARGPFPEPQS